MRSLQRKLWTHRKWSGWLNRMAPSSESAQLVSMWPWSGHRAPEAKTVLRSETKLLLTKEPKQEVRLWTDHWGIWTRKQQGQSCVVGLTLDEAGDGKAKIARVTQMSMQQDTEREGEARNQTPVTSLVERVNYGIRVGDKYEEFASWIIRIKPLYRL